MNRTLSILLLTSFIVFSCQSRHKTGYGSPLVVLTESDPWLMVVGSDAPTIAIYENDQVIYKKILYDKVEYYEVKLSNEDLLQTIDKLGITDSLKKQPKYTNVSGGTDLPTAVLYLNLDSVKTISVSGHLRWGRDRDKTPLIFLPFTITLSTINMAGQSNGCQTAWK